MPLFIAKILVSSVVDIPVFAETFESAVEYINSTKEWEEDYEIERIVDKDSLINLHCVTKVNHPKQSPWEGNVNCWGNSFDDVDVSRAFHSEQLGKFFKSALSCYGEVHTDEQLYEAYKKLHAMENKLREEFDSERNG